MSSLETEGGSNHNLQVALQSFSPTTQSVRLCVKCNKQKVQAEGFCHTIPVGLEEFYCPFKVHEGYTWNSLVFQFHAAFLCPNYNSHLLAIKVYLYEPFATVLLSKSPLPHDLHNVEVRLGNQSEVQEEHKAVFEQVNGLSSFSLN